jgi:hypothetical protein
MHGKSQEGTILSDGLLLKYPTFMSVKHLDSGDDTRSLRISQTAYCGVLCEEHIDVVVGRIEGHVAMYLFH